MNQYFGYVRVSTVKQGEQGVSLQQQREAIERYAQRNNCEVIQWFEEQETAAKQGRPLFAQMMKLLRRGKARGVIIHKIDRSARNLRDWADLGELIDQGVEVCFANESLDLRSRGGRLSADIQAVVAADYIRNLREETRKGFYGRLKQGLYPMPAPLGYLDMGQGKPKALDPNVGPLIRGAFELYSTGRFNSKAVAREVATMGLRSRSGKILRADKLTRMFSNPFYIGLIRIKRTNETYPGAHQPLVSKSLFDRVQDVLHGRLSARPQRHDFLFRRRLNCGQCQIRLVGETHKGFIYYRCQNRDCPTRTVREEIVDKAVQCRFLDLRFSDDERRYIDQELRKARVEDSKRQEEAIAGIQLKLGQIDDRLNRLTDAYIDRVLDKEAFEARKNALLMERKDVEEKRGEWSSGTLRVTEELAHFLERAGGAYLAYKTGNLYEKRDLVDSLTSNCVLNGKLPEITLAFPFQEIANRFEKPHGGPSRGVHRTWTRLLQSLTQFIHTQPHEVGSSANSSHHSEVNAVLKPKVPKWLKQRFETGIIIPRIRPNRQAEQPSLT
jgi:site-specific DNA recombinase